jgi:hypothetical protein
VDSIRVRAKGDAERGREGIEINIGVKVNNYETFNVTISING